MLQTIIFARPPYLAKHVTSPGFTRVWSNWGQRGHTLPVDVHHLLNTVRPFAFNSISCVLRVSVSTQFVVCRNKNTASLQNVSGFSLLFFLRTLGILI